MKHYLEVEKSLHKSGIDKKLIELIKIRSSQIKRCAYCLNMHTIDALKLGETNQRIFLLNAWRETLLVTIEEKLVLELTERLTNVSTNQIDQELILRLSKYFDSEQYAYLVLMIGQINIWNRINISTNNDIDFKYK